MRAGRLLPFALASLALVAAGCGGGGSGGGSSGGHLVADVGKADVAVHGKTVVATTKVKVGGVAGKHLVLQWGIIDAVAGRVSQEERVAQRFTTTRDVADHDVSVKFPLPPVPTMYLVHFALYSKNSFLSSADTPEFESK
jgi:hypothetical protein